MSRHDDNKPKRKPGRPKGTTGAYKPAEERKSKTIAFNVTGDEYARMVKASKGHSSVGIWARETLLKHARKKR